MAIWSIIAMSSARFRNEGSDWSSFPKCLTGYRDGLTVVFLPKIADVVVLSANIGYIFTDVSYLGIGNEKLISAFHGGDVIIGPTSGDKYKKECVLSDTVWDLKKCNAYYYEKFYRPYCDMQLSGRAYHTPDPEEEKSYSDLLVHITANSVKETMDSCSDRKHTIESDNTATLKCYFSLLDERLEEYIQNIESCYMTKAHYILERLHIEETFDCLIKSHRGDSQKLFNSLMEKDQSPDETVKIISQSILDLYPLSFLISQFYAGLKEVYEEPRYLHSGKIRDLMQAEVLAALYLLPCDMLEHKTKYKTAPLEECKNEHLVKLAHVVADLESMQNIEELYGPNEKASKLLLEILRLVTLRIYMFLSVGLIDRVKKLGAGMDDLVAKRMKTLAIEDKDDCCNTIKHALRGSMMDFYALVKFLEEYRSALMARGATRASEYRSALVAEGEAATGGALLVGF